MNFRTRLGRLPLLLSMLLLGLSPFTALGQFVVQRGALGQPSQVFDETNTWNLPVVDQHKFVGFISKSSVLNRYRQLLKEYSS